MPPRTASSAATSKRSGGRKKKSVEEIDTDSDLPLVISAPAASKKRSGGRNLKKKSVEEIDTDSDLPLVISAPEASNKRKTRKSVDVTVVKPDPSPDASPLPKKKRVHSPAPVPKATEEEDAVEDDDAGIASMPRRSRTASSKAAMMDGKDASGRSKSKNSQGVNMKALSSLSDGERSDPDVIKSVSFKPILEGNRLMNDSDESLPATPTKSQGSSAKAAKISLTNNSDSDSVPITPKKARAPIAKVAKHVPVGSSEDDDEPLGVDQWPATPKAKGKPTVSASGSNNIGPDDSDESDAPRVNNDSKKRTSRTVVDKGKKASDRASDRSTQGKTPSQLLYPTEFNVPADSDYDDQDQDAFEPIDTQLMPKSLQDPKLRFDYTRLPDMPYIEMQPFQRYGEHAAERYLLVWAALKDEGDELVRRRFRRAIKFKNCLPYINPARAQRFLTRRDGDRLVLANSQGRKYPAVLLTTGVVSHCYLITGAKSMTGNYNVKHIGIYPFNVEHQRAMSAIGGGLAVQHIAGPMYDGRLVFQTRREMDSNPEGVLSSPGIISGTPSRSGRTPIKFTKPSSTIYPTSLSFNDRVPIYDLRRNNDFMFTDEDLNNISSLPLYKNGTKDLPSDSVVTVGYAVGTYPYRGSNPALASSSGSEYTALSLNVLFVLLLGSVDRERLNDMANSMP